MEPLIDVRLQCDYGLGWPVWIDDGVFDVRSKAPFSDALKREIDAWAMHFQSNFAHESGWRTPDGAARHRAVGTHLRDALQKELGPGYRVRVALWAAPD